MRLAVVRPPSFSLDGGLIEQLTLWSVNLSASQLIKAQNKSKVKCYAKGAYPKLWFGMKLLSSSTCQPLHIYIHHCVSRDEVNPVAKFCYNFGKGKNLQNLWFSSHFGTKKFPALAWMKRENGKRLVEHESNLAKENTDSRLLKVERFSLFLLYVLLKQQEQLKHQKPAQLKWLLPASTKSLKTSSQA